MCPKRPTSSKSKRHRATRSSRSRRAAQRPGHLHAQWEQRVGDMETAASQAKIDEENLRVELARARERWSYYEELFNSEPVGSLILTASEIVRDVNQAGAAMLRCERSQIIGESFLRFVASDSLKPLLNHLRQSHGAKKTVTVELMLKPRKGELLPVELVASAVSSGRRWPQIHRVTIIDISGRRRTERDLVARQRNFRSLVHSIEGVVWEGTGDGRDLTFVSRQAERIFGYPIERWLAEPDFWFSHIHPDDRERVRRERTLALSHSSIFSEEFRMLTGTDRVVWVRNNVNVVRHEDSRLGLQGIMVNISDLKAADEALREERRALETLHRIGMSLISGLDLTKLVREVTEAGKLVTGAQFGAFSYRPINRHDGNNNKSTEFTWHTSGAPPETFQSLPRPQHNPALSPAEAEREVIRIGDLQQEVRGVTPQARAGQPIPVRSYLAVPVISHSGETLGWLLFGHTKPGVFTERAQYLLAGIAAEAAIALDNARLHYSVARSEARFRELAEVMPQIVWTASEDGKFDYVNNRWMAYTGQQPGDGIKDWTSFLEGDGVARCAAAWRKSLQSGEPLEIECRLRGRMSEGYRWHLIRAEPIKDAEGRITRWFGTCTDIEDQKRSEQEVRHLNAVLEKRVRERTAQLEASNRELEAFCYSVSHDLRAPLRSIDAFSQLVREDYAERLDEQGHQYLNTVSDASRQMARLIDDLLHLSRVSRSEMFREPVNLSKLAEQIIVGYRQLEPKRQVEVVIAPDLKASGDERLLRIALDNLLNNAWKFTSKEPQPRIEVGWQQDGGDSDGGSGSAQAAGADSGEMVFFVRDNGAGFDMVYSGKLFGAFQRLHSMEEFPGHGVGLATVQRIINRHGGRIWADGEVGKGATFYFTLPESVG